MTLSGGPEPYGSTPFDVSDLVLDRVQDPATLNAAEQASIVEARAWAFGLVGRRPIGGVDDLLTEAFCDKLHRRMFGGIWAWAGQRRHKPTNIGVAAWQIAGEFRNALDDARWWHTHNVYGAHELAVRIHHRLVSVHPYPDGNGRHSRMIADLYLNLVGAPALAWGDSAVMADGARRKAYITAIGQATPADVTVLLEFARGH